jgi:hypothetical protein
LATEALALPTARRIQLQLTEVWGVVFDAGRQNEEILKLKRSIESKRIAVIEAVVQGDQPAALRLLDAMGADTARLEEVESQDVGIFGRFCNLLRLMETCVSGRKRQ